jgi:hypothetical protein
VYGYPAGLYFEENPLLLDCIALQILVRTTLYTYRHHGCTHISQDIGKLIISLLIYQKYSETNVTSLLCDQPNSGTDMRSKLKVQECVNVLLGQDCQVRHEDKCAVYMEIH